MNRLIGICLFSGLMNFLTACHNSAEEQPDSFDSGVIHISCDESFKPVIDAELQVFRNDYPQANIIVQYKPEADCLRDSCVEEPYSYYRCRFDQLDAVAGG